VLLRVAIGFLVELGFISWIVIRGRSAVARGLTGLFGEEELVTADLSPSA
jgi:hypothetical protein